jgi:hypothetical protein
MQFSLVFLSHRAICSSFSFFSSDAGGPSASLILSEPFFTWDWNGRSDSHAQSQLLIVSRCLMSSDSRVESASLLETVASARSDLVVYSAFAVQSSSHSGSDFSVLSDALVQSGILPRSGFAIQTYLFEGSLYPAKQRLPSSQRLGFSMTLGSSLSYLRSCESFSSSHPLRFSAHISHSPLVSRSSGFVYSHEAVIVRITSLLSLVGAPLFGSSPLLFLEANANDKRIGSSTSTLIVWTVPGLFVLLLVVAILVFFWVRSRLIERSTDESSFDVDVEDSPEVQPWPFLPGNFGMFDRPRDASDCSSDVKPITE